MSSVINLRERFGKRYRIRVEEGGSRADPAYYLIPCIKGHIYPWGGDLLAASIDTRGTTRQRIASLPGAEVRQDGDDGATITFPVGLFGQVARLMGARRRRQVVLTPEQRERLIGRLALARKAA